MIVREIMTDTTPGDIDTAKFQGDRGEYAFSATADGQVIVTHAVEDSLDGTDRLRNIEKVQFLNGGALNIIVGTPGNDVLNGTAQDDLMLGLEGADTLNGGAGNDILVGGADGTTTTTTAATYADNFNDTASAIPPAPPTGVRIGLRRATTTAQARSRSTKRQQRLPVSIGGTSPANLTARKSSAPSTSPARRRPPV